MIAFAESYAQIIGAKSPQQHMDTAHYYMTHSYDVLKYSISVNLYHCYFKPFTTDFPATEIITFKVDSALNFIRLNATNTSIRVDSVGLAGVSFTHANDTLVIRLDQNYQPGQEVNVKIIYRHKNVQDHAFYADDGFVFTDTPPEGSRKWFPCWDRPSDKALFDLIAKVPLNVKLASNGSLKDSLITGDTIYYHWASRDPIATYLITITSKIDFSLNIIYWHKVNHIADSIPVRFYFQASQNPDTIEDIIRPMINYFSLLFGEYPFEKIGFATLNGSFPWGGMENQTMINLAIKGWQEGLISHEFSHQWFGDLITCGTWADIWLNESFATYCESLWLGHLGGDLIYRTHLERRANNYLANNPGFAIYNPSWAIRTPDVNMLYNAMVEYDKGACVLHQLRYVIGDLSFFHLIKAYTTDTNFMFKNAVTKDFIDKTNEICGSDFNWFFDEWIYHPNHPLYLNSYEITNLDNGKWGLRLLLSQYQTNTVFFKMPVQIEVVFADSSKIVMRVINDMNNQLYDFIFAKKPVYIIFDPFHNILLKKAIISYGIKPAKDNNGFGLSQNRPDPFRTSTAVNYHLPKPSKVKISVMDSIGRNVLTVFLQKNNSGNFTFTINAKDLKPGLYFYKIEAGKYNDTRRMVLIK
jgi:aminopeptidase N